MSKPKPFQRPRIDLGDLPQNREWGHWPVSVLTQGDVIPDVGMVHQIEYLTYIERGISDDTMLVLKVTNVAGVEHSLKFVIRQSDENSVPTIWAFH